MIGDRDEATIYNEGMTVGYEIGFKAGTETHQPSQWQPIETGPKDGQWILLLGESGYINRPYRCHVGQWSAYHSDWRSSEDCSFEDDGDPPTHWMPLPEPPKAVQR